MPEDKLRRDPHAESKTTKVALPDGFRVGIVNLDDILNEVADLNLSDVSLIKTELLEKVKIRSYVAHGAENDYSDALFYEYQKKFGGPGPVLCASTPEPHKSGPG